MKDTDRAYLLMGFRIVGDFGVSIALPIVLFAWLGKILDQRWGTAPYLLILGFFLAAGLSGFMIYRKAKKYGEEFTALEKKEEDNKHGPIDRS